MNLPIERHRDVLRDIVECADYFSKGSVLAADRFVTDVQNTIELIQRMRVSGDLKRSPMPDLPTSASAV